jgi:hypothetical protein
MCVSMLAKAIGYLISQFKTSTSFEHIILILLSAVMFLQTNGTPASKLYLQHMIIYVEIRLQIHSHLPMMINYVMK